LKGRAEAKRKENYRGIQIEPGEEYKVDPYQLRSVEIGFYSLYQSVVEE
jgi:hypothetical protein